MSKHSKILRRKLLKYSIDICDKIFPDIIHKTRNFLYDIDLFTMEPFVFKYLWSKQIFHFEQVIWKKNHEALPKEFDKVKVQSHIDPSHAQRHMGASGWVGKYLRR